MGLEAEPAEAPRPPGELLLLDALERQHNSYWGGGYANQPHILSRAMEACALARQDVEEVKIHNDAVLERQRLAELARQKRGEM